MHPPLWSGFPIPLRSIRASQYRKLFGNLNNPGTQPFSYSAAWTLTARKTNLISSTATTSYFSATFAKLYWTVQYSALTTATVKASIQVLGKSPLAVPIVDHHGEFSASVSATSLFPSPTTSPYRSMQLRQSHMPFCRRLKAPDSAFASTQTSAPTRREPASFLTTPPLPVSKMPLKPSPTKFPKPRSSLIPIQI